VLQGRQAEKVAKALRKADEAKKKHEKRQKEVKIGACLTFTQKLSTGAFVKQRGPYEYCVILLAGRKNN